MYQNTSAFTPNEALSDDSTSESFAKPIADNIPVSILEKISHLEKGAVGECLECYGNFVWAMARKYTKNTEEAENSAREIFLDIWENAEKFDSENLNEPAFIARIALRRLLKINKQGRNL